jgi:hypothetical protein
MKIANPRLQSIFNYLSKLNQTAYKDEFLIPNNVLSKNPFFSNLTNNYLLKNKPDKAGFFFKTRKLLRYYIRNFSWLVAFTGKSLAHYLSCQNYQPHPENKNLILIDSTIYVKRTTNENSFEDILFPGLLKVLKDQKISFAITSVLYDSGNLMQLFRAFRFFKKNKIPVLTEYQIIGGTDFLRMLLFLLLYPVSLVRFIKSLGASYEDQLLTHALWESSDDIVASSYMRLLFGKRLCALPVSEIKCISWYENQARHKAFYRGLHNLPGKVTIFGAQLLIWPESVLNIHADEEEVNSGLVPEKVIVNGSYYLMENSRIDYQVGPSFRYKKLLHFNISPKNSKHILAVLSAWESEIESAISFLVQFPESIELRLKFHPSTDTSGYRNRLPPNIKVTQENLYECFKTAKLVIGQSTGALVEAISLGIPAIVLDDNVPCHDFIPSQTEGKGLIWDKASNVQEAIELIGRFEQNLKTKPDEIEFLAKKYKEIFFCEPTREKIIAAFELNAGYE